MKCENIPNGYLTNKIDNYLLNNVYCVLPI